MNDWDIHQMVTDLMEAASSEDERFKPQIDQYDLYEFEQLGVDLRDVERIVRMAMFQGYLKGLVALSKEIRASKEAA